MDFIVTIAEQGLIYGILALGVYILSLIHIYSYIRGRDSYF